MNAAIDRLNDWMGDSSMKETDISDADWLSLKKLVASIESESRSAGRIEQAREDAALAWNPDFSIGQGMGCLSLSELRRKIESRARELESVTGSRLELEGSQSPKAEPDRKP